MSKSVKVVSFSAKRRRKTRQPPRNYFTNLSGIAFPRLVIHSVGYLPRCRDWNYDRVISPFWRMYYNSCAGNYVLSGGKRYDMDDCRVLMIPENVEFTTRSNPHAPHLYSHFSMLPSRSWSPTQPYWISVDPSLQEALGQLRSFALQTSSPEQPQRLFHAASVVLHMCQLRAPLGRKKVWPEKLVGLIEAIEGSPAAEWYCATMARQVGMSADNFARWFKHNVGVTPARYVVHSRVRRASQLLTDTNRKLDDIAAEVGFPNRYYFTRVFTNLMQRAPARYRGAYREIFRRR